MGKQILRFLYWLLSLPCTIFSYSAAWREHFVRPSLAAAATTATIADITAGASLVYFFAITLSLRLLGIGPKLCRCCRRHETTVHLLPIT
nr:hypothetical protein CFP56_76406 [Quercus suber]